MANTPVKNELKSGGVTWTLRWHYGGLRSAKMERVTWSSYRDIKSLKTATINGPDGPLIAVMVGIDVPDPGEADAFMLHVLEKFKAHRMISPVETAGLLVSIIGDLSAQEFARLDAAPADHSVRVVPKENAPQARAPGRFVLQAAGLDTWPDPQLLGLPPRTAGGSVRVLPAGVALVISHRITSFHKLPGFSLAN